jgi:DNA mismatch endonuclease (patch repair protein)
MRPKKPDLKRSALMASVRQRGTAPELVVACALRRLGCAYRLNARTLTGSPDFSNRRRNWAIYVHGCFWHQHTGCRRATVPKANGAFWRDKFATNRRRDARAIRALRRAGFRVLIVWECETVDPDHLAERLSKILEPRRVGVGQPVDHRGVVENVAGLRRR